MALASCYESGNSNRKANNYWKGKLYEINVDYIDTLNYNTVKEFSIKKIEPASGWEKLIGELNNIYPFELTMA